MGGFEAAKLVEAAQFELSIALFTTASPLEPFPRGIMLRFDLSLAENLHSEHLSFMSNFYNADPDLCYLDGNSLGRLPLAAMQRVVTLVREGWGEDLIRGWNKDWIDLPIRLGDKIARLIGASEGEVVIADSTSINLFKLATAALQLKSGRSKVVTDATNFPSDLYILESAASSAGNAQQLHAVGSAADVEAPVEELLKAIDQDTALVSLSHVAFRSAAMWDMDRVTQAAHAAGALVLWDLSHSVGAIPVELNRCQADLAVGCTYKYLCGGPGAPAFLYVRKNLQSTLQNPLQGWFSHRSPFEFGPQYEPAETIERFLVGTPPILSLAAIEAGVDLVSQSGIAELRKKSIELSEVLISLFDRDLSELGFQLQSPTSAASRGSHISISHPEARRITQVLIDRFQVIPDFRGPDIIRIGIAPLYNTQQDIRKVASAMREIVLDKLYLSARIDDSPVT
ncbi:MAG: kynureninase [Planctomycetota bacterium]